MSTQAVALFHKAEELIRSGKDFEASQIYQELINDNTTSALSYFRLGEIYNRMNRPLDSLEAHIQALKLDPKLAESIKLIRIGACHHPKNVERVCLERGRLFPFVRNSLQNPRDHKWKGAVQESQQESAFFLLVPSLKNIKNAVRSLLPRPRFPLPPTFFLTPSQP